MFYITGDTHGEYYDILYRINENNIKEGDTLIVLGDFGANFFLNKRDREFKCKLSEKGITFFCIHGNHEERPKNISSYITKEWNGGTVYYEEAFPYILFAKDGEIYNINGKKCFVCGGAYSVDKYYRAFRGCLNNNIPVNIDALPHLRNLCGNIDVKKEDRKIVDKFVDTLSPKVTFWFKDEQPNDEIKRHCENVLEKINWKVDCVFTHTSPEKYEPTEVFLPGLNQNNVDKTTEKWFDKIEDKLDYEMWYAGHYHTNKKVNEHFTFLFNNVLKFE